MLKLGQLITLQWPPSERKTPVSHFKSEMTGFSEAGMSKAKTGQKLGLLPHSQIVNAKKNSRRKLKMLLPWGAWVAQ